MGRPGCFRRRAGRVALALAVALLLSGGLLAWRLHSAPLVLPDAARTWLTARLQPPGAVLSLNKAALYWPRLAGPLYVQVEGLDVARGGEAAHLPDMGLALSVPHLLLGQIRARGLIIVSPEVVLLAGPDGGLALDLGKEGGADAFALPRSGLDLAALGRGLPPALADLSYVEIQGARVKAHYAQGAREVAWAAPPVDARLARAERGLVLEMGTTAAPRVRVRAAWEAATGDARAEVEGEALDAGALWALLPDLPTAAVPVPPLSLRARATWHAAEREGALEALTLTDGTATIAASGTLTQEEGGAWAGTARARLDALEQARLAQAWPHDLRHGPAWEWLGQKLSEGAFRDVVVRGNLTVGPGGARITGGAADFAFTGMHLDYLPPLAPVEGASGTGHLDGDSQMLTLAVGDGARVGGLALAHSTVAIDHMLAPFPGRRVKVGLSLKGSLPALGQYLEPEPINVARYAPFDLGALAGSVTLDASLDLPAQPEAQMADIGVAARGKVTGGSIPRAVGPVALTGAALDITLKDWLLTLKGQGDLGGAAVTFTREMALQPPAAKAAGFASRTEARLALPEALRAQLGIDLAPYVAGLVAVEVTETRAQDKSGRAEVAANLGPSALAIAPLGYAKAPGPAARATLTARFAPGGALAEVRDLAVTGPDLSLKRGVLAFGPKGAVTALTIPEAAVGATRAAVTYRAPAGKRASLAIEGAVVDATAFLSPKPQEAQKGRAEQEHLDVSLSAQDLITGPGRTLGPVSLAAAQEAGGRLSRLEMRADTRPGTLEVHYGRGTFDLTATDAGAALAVLGHGGVEGGTAHIAGREGPRGTVQGTAQMDNFTARNAPILGQLLGAMSLTGILDTLNGRGLVFTRLETAFTWAWRPGGAVLTFASGRSSGNALGLTFSGTHDRASGALDLAGTLVPLAGVSGLVGKVPLLGPIVTGGGGGILAATYTIRGDLASPAVAVNPLAVLAPGVLRQILFQQ